MQNNFSSDWQLAVPTYTGGTLDPNLYSCGYAYYEGEDKSVMHQITDTTAEEFRAYCSTLGTCGYIKTFENEMDGNLYAAYTDENGGRWYIYYLTADGKTGTARVIKDSAASTPLDEFCYFLDGNGKGEFYTFNLNTGADDTYLIRLCDNKWIVVDGGTTGFNGIDPERKFADALCDFMRERSGLCDGEKLVIAAWYHTHAHRDHFLAFGAMIEKHHDGIVLERIIANVPDPDVITHNTNYPNFRECMSTLQRYFPDVMYLKAHTGMKIQLADVHITVLYTQEDHIDFWMANKDEFYAKWRNYHSMSGEEPDYEYCRQSYKVYDINNSSLNAIFELGGVRILELGDGFRWFELMEPYYSRERLTTDIIKAAHHFNNEETVPIYCELCESGKPMYILIPSNEIRLEKNEKRIMAALREGQRVMCGKNNAIDLFEIQNGKISVSEIPAAYSWQLSDENPNKNL